MITKDSFLTFVKKLDKVVSMGDKLIANPVLDTELMLDYTGFEWEAVEQLLELTLNKEGVDWVYWWYFERPRLSPGARAFDKSGLVIPTETPEDLWNLIKDCRI